MIDSIPSSCVGIMACLVPPGGKKDYFREMRLKRQARKAKGGRICNAGCRGCYSSYHGAGCRAQSSSQSKEEERSVRMYGFKLEEV